MTRPTPSHDVSVQQAKQYTPAGCCIYCGAREWSPGRARKLGDEHIIPEGLGGKLLLPECACQACEKETSQVELECLRGGFFAARAQKGFGKKRKRKPRYLPLSIRSDNRTVVELIPIEEYPGIIVTFLFDVPDVLLDAAPTTKCLSGGVAIGVLPTFGKLLAKYLPQGSVTFVPPRATATSQHLGRMLAKIAHSYAVAERGLDGFVPFLPPIILGRDIRYIAHYVGGTREIPQCAPEHYRLALKSVQSLSGQNYLMATIRLFSDIQGMPEYWVVVGQER